MANMEEGKNPQSPLGWKPESAQGEASQKPAARISFPKWLAPLGLAVAIMAAGAASVLALRIWDPLWNPFRPSPEKVLSRMITASAKAESGRIDARFQIKTPDRKTAEISISGNTDMSDKDNAKSAMKGSIVYDGKDWISADFIVIGKTIYFKIINLSQELLSSAQDEKTAARLQAAKGQWVRADAQDFAAGQPGDASREQAEVLAKKITEMARNKKLYSVKEQLPDGYAGGVKTYRYALALDNKELAKFFGEIMDESAKMQGGVSDSAFIIGMVKGMIGEAMDRIGEINMEISIGKKDMLPYNYKISKDIDLEQLIGFFSGTISLSADVNYSDYNKPVLIEAPLDARDFKEIFPQSALTGAE